MMVRRWTKAAYVNPEDKIASGEINSNLLNVVYQIQAAAAATGEEVDTCLVIWFAYHWAH